jgi:hypothetical protein
MSIFLFLFLMDSGFAQKGKPKPPPTPPPAPVVTTQEIVYSTSNNQGVQFLVVANADGSGQITIASGQWYNVPSWHPNGNEIIFSSAIPKPGIWSIKLNRNSSTGVSPATRIVPQNFWGGQTTPVWSPISIDFQDSHGPRHVIAYADRPANRTNLNIFLWDPATESSFNLTHEENHWESYPTWSPDGSHLVIVQTSATGGYPYDMKFLSLAFGTDDCGLGQNACVTAQQSLVRRISPDPGPSIPDCYAPSSPLCGDTTALLRPKFGNTGEEIALGGDLWIVPISDPAAAYNLIANIAHFPSGSRPNWSPDDTQIIYQGSIGSQRTVCGKKNWQGIARINANGDQFSNGCYVEFLINGPAQDPSWWRGLP